MITLRRPLFELGRVVATPAALQAISESGDDLGEYLARHTRGDWGRVSVDLASRNDAAIFQEGTCQSVYRASNGKKICIITRQGDGPHERTTSVMLDVES